MQFVLSTALVLIAGLACFLVYFIGIVFFSRGLKLPEDLKNPVERTPASGALLFGYQTVIIITLACLLNRISNHIVLSLDIIGISSALILIMFHILTVSKYSSEKSY